MVPLGVALSFAAVAFSFVIIPGPNTAYLISRSVCQGRRAGFASLLGILVGFLIYMLLTAYGITAILQAQPIAFEILRISGALYLLWLAWKAIRPGGESPFEIREVKEDSTPKLIAMGIGANLLNPKAAALYLTLLPQFVDPSHGSVLAQSVELGSIHLCISLTVSTITILMASKMAEYFQGRPTWLRIQRYILGGVLGGLALRLALERRR